MSADRHDQVRESVDEMRHDEREMEEQLSELEGDISEARDTAAARQDSPENAPPVGDWEDEATGSTQGEDAQDAVGADGEPIVEAAGDDATIGQVSEDFEGDASEEQGVAGTEAPSEQAQQDDAADDGDEPQGSAEKDRAGGDVDVATPES